MNLMDLVATLRMDVSQFLSGSKQAQGAMSEIDAATSRLSESIKNAGKGDLEALNQAFATLKVQGSTQLKQLNEEATAAFLEIKHSGIASATDIANAEAAQMQIRRQYYQSLGIDVGKTTEEIKKMNQEAMSSAAQLGALGAGLTLAITKPLMELAEKSLGLSESFRLAETTFTTMIGSGQKAQQFLTELKAFAASTPFEFPDLLDAAKRMNALGFSAEAVIPTMRTIGDTVAALGGGKPLIDRITLALGQMSTAGKVNAQDMRQLTEAGIGAWQILADKIGVSIPQAMEMARKGMISSAEAIPAILEGMNAKFGGLMDSQMQTITGRWSNIKDQISFVLADIGKALTPFASQALSLVEPIIEGIRGLVAEYQNLSPAIQGAVAAIGTIAAAAGPVIAAMATWQGGIALVSSALGISAGAGLAGIIGALLPELLTLAGVIAAVWAAWELWQLPSVQSAVQSVFDVLSSLWQSVLVPVGEFIAGVFVASWENLKESFNAAVAGIQKLDQFFTGLFATIKEKSGVFIELSDSMNNKLAPAMELIKQKSSELLEWFLKLPPVAANIKGMGDAWDYLRQRIQETADKGKAAMEGTATATQSSMATANAALAQAKKNLDEVTQAFKNKQATEQEVQAASSQLAAVQRIYNDELAKTQPALKAATEALTKARDEQDKAQAAVLKYRNELAAGKDVAERYARAQSDLEKAQKDVASATSNVEKITRQAGISFKEYDGGIEAVRRSLRDHKTATDDNAASLKQMNSATAELHNSDRIYADLIKSTLTPAHIPLYEALQNVKTAKDNARTAANNLITADSNLRDAMSNSKTSAEQLQAAQDGLKKAEDAAKEASQQMKEAMKDLHTAQQDTQKSAKELDDQFNALQKSMGAFARSEAPATTEAIKGVLAAVQSMNSAIDETAQTKAYRAQLALKDMGIKPKEDLDALAAKSREDFDIVTNSGTASATEITRAWVKMMEDRKAALQQNGKDLSEEEQRALDGMKAKLDNKPTLADKWADIYGGIRSATSQLGKDMVDVLFEGPESFADKAIASLKNIGKAVADHFVQPAMDAIGKFIATTITDLLSGKGLGGVLDSIKSIGKAISDVFSSGSSAASAAGGATSAGGAASGAGGIGSAASSGLTGLISAISGVVTAVTGVFGIFQNMHQETSLNAIEHNTRYSMMFLGEQGWDSIHGNTHDSKLLLENIRDWMQGAQYNTLRDISGSLDKKTSDLWYEIIGVKDKLTDVKDASAAVATNVGDGDLNKKATDIHLMLITISGSLDDIKKSSGEIKTNTGTISTSALETSIGTMDTNITTALGNIKTDMGNFFTNFNTNLTQALTPLSTSIGQINPNNAIQTAIANLQSAVTGAIYAVDPRSIMTTMSSQLSSLSMLASLPQLLSNIGHSTTMTTTNTTQVILNVNGSPGGGQPISATDLGIRLRDYGINI